MFKERKIKLKAIKFEVMVGSSNMGLLGGLGTILRPGFPNFETSGNP